MSAKSTNAKIVEFQTVEPVAPYSPPTPIRAELVGISENGNLRVRSADGHEFDCDWLENTSNANINLELSDPLLCIPPSGEEPGIVLGRIGKYQKPQPQEHVTIEAQESLTLKCGEASVELRNDGRAMVKGEDVLLRAKGTQRIRAASVAIN